MKRSVASFVLVLAAALAACSFLDKQDPTKSMSVEKLYAEAKEALDGGQYDLAIKRYETLEARFPYGRYSQQGQLEIAYAYYKQNEQASAVAAAERFMKLHPNHPNVDYAYYLKGLVYFREDQGLFGYVYELDLSERDPKSMRESFAAFKELVQKFPESRYSEDAQLRMRYLTNALGMYEVNVARYYYARGAYIAAANRAQTALISYPQTPSNEHALDVMVRSYRQMGLTQLADDAHRILEKTYPQSVYIAGVPEKPWWKIW